MNLSRTLLNNATFVITSTHVHQGSHPFNLLYDHICTAAFDNTDTFEDMKCYPGTRTLLLERLESWIAASGNLNRLITWLNGPMGSGKTAVARTLADRALTSNKLMGTFIFSRTVPGRNDESRFVTTLAYQLAIAIPLARPFIEEQILHNPAVLQQSLNQQLDFLILEPLQKMRTQHPDIDFTTLPSLIIVDGLDECGAASPTGKEERQLKVLDLIRRLSQSRHIFPFVTLVLSRPERHLKNWFVKGILNHTTYRLRLDKSYKPETDIRLFVTQCFLSILDDHPNRHLLPVGWPYSVRETDYRLPINAINFIVAASAGRFIYAAVVMKFIRSQRHRPDKRLLIVLRNSMAKDESNSPNTNLDVLYHQILDATDDHQTVLKILAYNSLCDCAAWTTVPLLRIQKLLDISEQDMRHSIDKLESLLTLTLKPFLTFYHSSFGEFLDDPQRSKHWYIDIEKHAPEFAIRASKLFEEEGYIGGQKSYLNIFVMACRMASPSTDVLNEIERWCRFLSFPALMRFLDKVPMSIFVRRWHVGTRAFTDVLGLHLCRLGKHTVERAFISELAVYVKPQLGNCLLDPDQFSTFLRCVFCVSNADTKESFGLPSKYGSTPWPTDLRRLFWAVIDWGLGCVHLQRIFSIPSPDFLDDALVTLLRRIGNRSALALIPSQGWYWLTHFIARYGPSVKLWTCMLDSDGDFTPYFRQRLRESDQMDRFFNNSPRFRIRSPPQKRVRQLKTGLDIVLAPNSGWNPRQRNHFYLQTGSSHTPIQEVQIPPVTLVCFQDPRFEEIVASSAW